MMMSWFRAAVLAAALVLCGDARAEVAELSMGGTPVSPGNPVPTAPATSPLAGGVTAASRIPSAAATVNLTNAKATPGRVYKVYACNTAASARFVKFYNAAAPTVGTTAVFFSRQLPATTCLGFDVGDVGWYFSVAISYALTTGNADSDATALTAGDVTQLSVEYQ